MESARDNVQASCGLASSSYDAVLFVFAEFVTFFKWVSLMGFWLQRPLPFCIVGGLPRFRCEGGCDSILFEFNACLVNPAIVSYM